MDTGIHQGETYEQGVTNTRTRIPAKFIKYSKAPPPPTPPPPPPPPPRQLNEEK